MERLSEVLTSEELAEYNRYRNSVNVPIVPARMPAVEPEVDTSTGNELPDAQYWYLKNV